MIVGWFAVSRGRTPGGRLLLASFLLALLASLGPWLTVAGRRLVTLPWSRIDRVPLYRDLIVGDAEKVRF